MWGGIFINKKELYCKIRELRNKLLSCGLTEPFDIFEICALSPNLEIAVIPFKTKGLRGIAQLANEESPVNCILVNSDLSQKEQNFHGMHELMHICFPGTSAGASFKCYDKIRPSQNGYLEWLANEGAAEMLMPYERFVPHFWALYSAYIAKAEIWNICYGGSDLYGVIAKEFKVTPKAVMNRINSLSYEIDQYSRGVPINEVKILSYTQRQKLGIITPDYQSEIKKAEVYYDFSLAWDDVI